MIKQGKITIGPKEIPVAFSLDTAKVYKKTFKRDFWSDLEMESNRTDETYNIPKTNKIALQMVWAFAKTADSKIQRVDRWAKQFNNVSGLFMIDKIDKFLKG